MAFGGALELPKLLRAPTTQELFSEAEAHFANTHEAYQKVLNVK